jgi:hypothetical protein
MAIKNGTGMQRKRGPGRADLESAIDALVKQELLVGFPAETSERKEVEGDEDMTNAALAYIHDNGMPEQNIPQRQFMRPAINEVMPTVRRKMLGLAKKVAGGSNADEVEKGFHSVGLTVQRAIRAKLNEGIPPPLSDRTLRERAARGREGAMWELAWRDAGAPPGVELAKPLIDTAQMRNAVNYVVRDRKKRRK